LGVRRFLGQALHLLAHPPVELLESAIELLVERRRRFTTRGRRSRRRLATRLLCGIACRAATLAARRWVFTSAGFACALLALSGG
jgi:hypothetical protein